MITVLLAIAYALCAAIVWFAGARALLLWGATLARRARGRRTVPPTARPATEPRLAGMRIALLSCTADDFDPSALSASMGQRLPVDTVILDDSRDPDVRARIDAFADAHDALVVRRAHRTGFKAGNLNHGLAALRGRYDAYIVLDSDTVLSPTFAEVTARALVADPTLACVQGVPSAGGRTAFARLFGPLVRAQTLANHVPRSFTGLPLFLGRGALLSAYALDTVDGFPETVAEDLALSTRLRAAGWGITHCADAGFEEAFPVDYAAFRTQVSKTAEGATQFLRTELTDPTPLARRERLDALVETALLPLGALAGLGLAVSGALLAAFGASPAPWVVVATAVFALAPLAPGALARLRAQGPLASAVFLTAASALYASIALLTVRRVVHVLRGRDAAFVVTPKAGRRVGPLRAITVLRIECASAAAAVAVAIACSAPGLALAFGVPALTAVVLLGVGPWRPHRSARLAV